MRRVWLRSIAVALVVAGASGAWRTAEGNDVAQPRVFELSVNGSFLPEAADIGVLPNGEIIVLAADGSPALTRIDLDNRAHALSVPAGVRPDYGNAVVATGDGALLFSAGGRVLRREADGRLSTVAGRQSPATASGDGGPAVGAGMEPTGLALLPDGSLLIADRRNNRIRRVDAAGRISTVAGTGAAGSDGDGGPAAQARLTAPERIIAFPDGAYVVTTGRDVLRVRRVEAGGRITTVLGPGREGVSRACADGPAPARSLHISMDDFTGGIASQPDGSFLIAASSVGEDDGLVAGGVMRVAEEIASPVICASGAAPTRPDGRDVYVAGRPVGDAFTDVAPSHVAVAPDGGLLLDFGYYDTRLRLITTPGTSQRLAGALTPATLTTIFGGQVGIVATEQATALLKVFHKRRREMRVAGPAQPGESTLQLPRRLGRGVHTIELRLTTADGRTATHRLRVLGRPFIAIRYAKRLIRRSFVENAIGEGTGSITLSRCRRQGPRRVRCLAAVRFGGPGRRHREIHSIELRPDGVLQFRMRSLRGRTLWTYAITP